MTHPVPEPIWGYDDLYRLRENAAAGMTLAQCARSQGGEVTPQHCDLALWALVGRTIEETVDHMAKRIAA